MNFYLCNKVYFRVKQNVHQEKKLRAELDCVHQQLTGCENPQNQSKCKF